MGTSATYLPPAASDETIQNLLYSLDLPPARFISVLESKSVYHSIYLLNFHPKYNSRLEPAKTRGPDDSTDLVLRVAGKQLPRIKTINEVSVIGWVKRNTKVPVPSVVRFDASENNALGHEFTLLEKATGVGIDKLWNHLSTATKYSVVSQIADYLAQIHAHSFELIGGMQLSHEDGSIIPGPVVDEASWQAPDVAKHWAPGESLSTLNISGPYESYTSLCAAQVERAIYATQRHDSLAWCRDLIPRLQACVNMLTNDRERVRDMKLNDVKVVLAHNDLQLSNIMYDPLTGEVTSILD